MTQVELKTEFSTPNPDKLAAVAARGDYLDHSLIGDGLNRAADSIGEEGQSNNEALTDFIEQLLQRGHFGPFEHPRAYFAVEGLSRDQMAQVTRHRVGFSFDVQSMRYVNFEGASFTTPPEVEEATLELETDTLTVDGPVEVPAESLMKEAYDTALDRYQDLIEAGVEKEDARKVLPIGTEVNMTFSANLRALMHVFDLRVSGAAQDDTRGFAEQILEETREWAPITVNEYEEHVKNQSLNSP
jgi:thymidylate synthase (FAD)